jgi:hypothetical protein
MKVRKPMNDKPEDFQQFADGIAELLKGRDSLAQMAVEQYKPIADDIISGRLTDSHQIDLTLDWMCDFCFNDNMLKLYKAVLRSILQNHPEIVASHIQQYREMWDENYQNNQTAPK